MAANRDERALRRPGWLYISIVCLRLHVSSSTNILVSCHTARPIRSISTPLSTFTAKQHDQRASVVTLQPSSPPYLVTAVVSPVVSAFARIVRQRPGFDALPLELRVRVFKYLSVVDVMRAARVGVWFDGKERGERFLHGWIGRALTGLFPELVF